MPQHRRGHLNGCLAAIGLALTLGAPGALAQGTVKIGAIYPLSGNAASAGTSAKHPAEPRAKTSSPSQPAGHAVPSAARAGCSPACRSRFWH